MCIKCLQIPEAGCNVHGYWRTLSYSERQNVFCQFTEVLLLNVCNEAVRVCSRVFKDNDKEGRKWWRAAKKLPVCPTQPSFFGSCNNNIEYKEASMFLNIFHRV